MSEESDGLSVGMECVIKIIVAGNMCTEEDMEGIFSCLNRIHFPEEIIIAEVIYPELKLYRDRYLIHRHRDKDSTYFDLFVKAPPIEEWFEEWKRKRA